MAGDIENWKTQIRKGYLELCLLNLISAHGRMYGFDIIEKLEKIGLPVKEGTLYPLLSRMTSDGTLAATWETENNKGHPRKFYSLTKNGEKFFKEMRDEFERMNEILQKLSKQKEGK